MFDFLFAHKEPKGITTLYAPFEAIEVDIHSHLIPGVDDGSPDLPTSIALIQEMVDLGFKKIITTPHISELYPNELPTLLNGLEQVRKQLKREQINVEIELGAEYMINDVFEQKVLANEPLLTLPDNHILVELSHMSEPVNLFKVIQLLIDKGYVPVLAHPERYRYYNNNLMQYQKLINAGCHLQVNVLSLDGYYGRMVSDCAWALLNNYMIDFIGSDFHHHRHISTLKSHISAKTQHILNNYSFQNRKWARKRSLVG
jgi:protein-tyrosine phosphatase